MRLRDYLYEQAETLLLWVFGMLVLGGFLWVTGTEIPVVLCVEGVWFFATLLSHGRKYLALKQRYAEVESAFALLKEKYLFTEVLPKPDTLLEQLYFSCSREANKAMLEKIEEISAGSREYKEYMEGWVHEIKNPVTAMELFCKNHPAKETEELQTEIQRLDYGATILMVTHDVFSASYCSRILFLKDGRIFNEIRRGEKSRKAFFQEILDVVTLMGGDVSNAK